MKTYRLDYRYICLLILFVALLAWAVSDRSGPPSISQILAAIWFPALFYYSSRVSYRITVDTERQELTFKSLFITNVLRPGDVLNVYEAIFTLEVNHRCGNCRVSTLMNGLGEIKQFLHSFNPDAKWSVYEKFRHKGNPCDVPITRRSPTTFVSGRYRFTRFRSALPALLAFILLVAILFYIFN